MDWLSLWNPLFSGAATIGAIVAAAASWRGVSIMKKSHDVVERPYLAVDMRKYSGMKYFPDSPALQFASALKFDLVNHGRTPAIIREWCFAPRESTTSALPAPIDPTQTPGLELPPIIIGAEKSLEWSEHLNAMDYFTRPGDRPPYFFFMGYIRYDDMFGSHYTSGFCLLWKEGDFLMAGADGYNYTKKDSGRKRARGYSADMPAAPPSTARSKERWMWSGEKPQALKDLESAETKSE